MLGVANGKLAAALLCVFLLGAIATAAGALEIWSGHTYLFEKANFADWTLEENQDRITDSVWLTRKDNQGPFNIAQEDGYVSTSPADTEWAYGSAADYASLTFQTWRNWHGNDPASTIGLDAVVHLIGDDIYIDINFVSFTGSNGGGGFAYWRGEPIPVPVGESTLSQVRALY